MCFRNKKSATKISVLEHPNKFIKNLNKEKMLKNLLKKIKIKVKVFAGQITPIYLDIKLDHVWYGNAYGGFYLYTKHLNEQSIVYSFGIGEDVSFDKEVIEKHQCRVFGFDPTPKSIEYINAQRLSTHFNFQPYGIDVKTGVAKFNLPAKENYVSGSLMSHKNVDSENYINVPMKCFSEIASSLNHQRIDVLKMDIEGSEFEVIENILASGIQIDQILIELHERFFSDGKNKILGLLNIMKNHGYLVFAVSDSYEEVSFIKVKE